MNLTLHFHDSEVARVSACGPDVVVALRAASVGNGDGVLASILGRYEPMRTFCLDARDCGEGAIVWLP